MVFGFFLKKKKDVPGPSLAEVGRGGDLPPPNVDLGSESSHHGSKQQAGDYGSKISPKPGKNHSRNVTQMSSIPENTTDKTREDYCFDITKDPIDFEATIGDRQRKRANQFKNMSNQYDSTIEKKWEQFNRPPEMQLGFSTRGGTRDGFSDASDLESYMTGITDMTGLDSEWEKERRKKSSPGGLELAIFSPKEGHLRNDDGHDTRREGGNGTRMNKQLEFLNSPGWKQLIDKRDREHKKLKDLRIAFSKQMREVLQNTDLSSIHSDPVATLTKLEEALDSRIHLDEQIAQALKVAGDPTFSSDDYVGPLSIIQNNDDGAFSGGRLGLVTSGNIGTKNKQLDHQLALVSPQGANTGKKNNPYSMKEDPAKLQARNEALQAQRDEEITEFRGTIDNAVAIIHNDLKNPRMAIQGGDAREQNISRMVELSDASSITYLIQGLKSGELTSQDATDFIRTRCLREMRLMAFIAGKQDGNNFVKPGTLSGITKGTPIGKGGELIDRRECESLLRELKQRDEQIRSEREGNLGKTLGQTQNTQLGIHLPIYEIWQESDSFDLGKLGKTDLSLLRKVFHAYSSEFSGSQSEGLSKKGWVDMLSETGILEESENDLDVFEVALQAVGGAKLTLNETDSELIFDMTVSRAQTVNGQSSNMSWLDFLTALKLVSKKQKRGIVDVIKDLTFSCIGDEFRRGWIDLTPHGVIRRLKGVFLHFTYGNPEISREGFVRILADTEILAPPKFTSNNAEHLFNTVVQKNEGLQKNQKNTTKAMMLLDSRARSLTEKKLSWNLFIPLLRKVAAERRLPVEDIIGQIAWSFGPQLKPDVNVIDGSQRLV